MVISIKRLLLSADCFVIVTLLELQKMCENAISTAKNIIAILTLIFISSHRNLSWVLCIDLVFH